MALAQLTRPRYQLAKSKADEFSSPYSAPPIPVLEIAQSNGVDVVFAKFGAASQKVAGFCDFAAEKIYINADDQMSRQLFTMAHEFGHWVLHKDLFIEDPDRYQVLPRYQAPKNNDAFEKEANAFAAALLVPERLLRPVKHASVQQLASVFGVSRQMMEICLKNV